MNRYIFTVTAGRSGQNTLTSLVESYVTSSHVACEDPKIHYMFKGFLSDIERRFRRKFIETHEMLGRGKVLTSFMKGDVNYIEAIAGKRVDIINRNMIDKNNNIYIDISKFFARGLHMGFQRILPKISLIHLVRDPIMNMHSFLNRNKNFFLDNGLPSSSKNLLILDHKNMEKSDLYLWAWCEMALRYEKMKEWECVDKYVEIHTSKLNDPAYISKCFDSLDLPHKKVQENSIRLNTNIESGYKKTRVTKSDIDRFEKFIDRVPVDVLDKISYLQSYDPYDIYRDL
jgi:hypothetical protein